MKPRILCCTEFSRLVSGYAVYFRNLLSRLHATNKYDLLELASYAHPDDQRCKLVPWKIYPVIPKEENARQKYDASTTAQFGDQAFEPACLQFNPHAILSLRDVWMDSFIETSPFRSYYYWIHMPTVDSQPQHRQWIATYSNPNVVLTYQDWSGKILQEQSGNKINWVGSASPCAAPEFRPLNRLEFKKQLGLENTYIVGTVMRNQRRKLFPYLFRSFREFLNETGRNNVLLYCHTSYPDAGWDIPHLLLEHHLSSKVLFTYTCNHCKQAFPSFFNDAMIYCPQCGERSAHIVSVQEGVSDEVLCRIYNIMDLYVQMANSEAAGMSQLEAAACGTPVFSVDYSGMSDIVRKLDGIPIKVLELDLEVETGCYRAIPDTEHFKSELGKFLLSSTSYKESWRRKTRANYEKYYNWDTTAQKWMDQIDSIDINKHEALWKSPPRIMEPSKQIPKGLDNVQFARWLIAEVLREPERLGTYMEARLIRDLNYGYTTMVLGGMYFNELAGMSNKPNFRQFDREQAYEHMVALSNRRNYWEKLRWQNIK